MNSLSVIIPTHNRASLLPRAIQSVLIQQDVPIECWIIDDGSTDHTRELIEKEFPNVRYVYQNNAGVSAARNHGLKLAQSPWIAFLDSDDEWLPGKLKAQIDFFQKNPDYKICQTEEIWIRNGRRVNPMKKHQKFGGWIFEKCLPLCAISPSAVMIHRDIFNSVGTFDESYAACEDYELWLRIASQYPVGLIETPYIQKYGGHADQLSHQFPIMDQFRIRALVKILSSGKLSPEQTAQAKRTLEAKMKIVHQGAVKRERAHEIQDLLFLAAPFINQAAVEKRFTPEDFPLFSSLREEDRNFLSSLWSQLPFTFQEFRELTVMARDFEMGREAALKSLWEKASAECPLHLEALDRKNRILEAIKKQTTAWRQKAPQYHSAPKKPVREPLKVQIQRSDKKIHGDCPVASKETVCCNLKTIDAVENCAFGCSYCTIQTFYGAEAVFDQDLKKKLSEISLDPNRFYHYGTGQSSDSLIWGNKNGNLDALCEFAAAHPNILLEFKTKSDNVAYFLENQLPPNIVLSWSLNPQTIIEQEEHFTASLDRRLKAARSVADRGIKVSFHFHPIIYYEKWAEDYPEVAAHLQTMFKPEEILFISLGSVTFIKPVMQQIRKRGEPTKILQMEFVKAPHNKWTYPEALKIEMFQTQYQALSGWHGKIFFYLCMEEAKFWDAVFGEHYATNELFESEMLRNCFEKISGKEKLMNLSGK